MPKTKYTKEQLENMTEEERVIASIDQREKKTYEKHQKNQSWARLKIRDEDGWDDHMRYKYFNMKQNLDKALIEMDYTTRSRRPKGEDQRKEKTKHNDGIWSDSNFENVQSRGSQLIRHTIWEDKLKQDAYEAKVKEYEAANKEIDFKPPVEAKELDNIKFNHYRDFLKDKKEQGVTPTTLKKYKTDLQKAFECTHAFGIKSHSAKRMFKPSIDKLCNEYKEEWEEKNPSVIRGRGETDNEKGYTLADARAIIAQLDHDPYAKTYVETLTYSGFRKETMQKVQWSDILDDEAKIDMHFSFEDGSKLKGGRAQIALTTDVVREDLQLLWNSGKFDAEDEIWGSRFSEYAIGKTIEEACEAAGVDYKGFHEFRAAAVEYYDEVAQNLSKEELVQGILKFVNFEVTDPKTGKTYKPNNPLVEKEDYKRDENGNKIPVYGAKGTSKEGTIVRFEKEIVLGADGHPVMEEKYTYDKLISRRSDYLRDVYVAEQISHNRSDANAPYRHRDKRRS